MSRSVPNQSVLSFVDQLSTIEAEFCSQFFIVEHIIAPMKKGFGGLLKRKRSKLPPKMASLPNGTDEKAHDLPNHVSPPVDLSEAFSKNYSNLNDARRDYDRRRKDLIDREQDTAWDRHARGNATNTGHGVYRANVRASAGRSTRVSQERHIIGRCSTIMQVFQPNGHGSDGNVEILEAREQVE